MSRGRVKQITISHVQRKWLRREFGLSTKRPTNVIRPRRDDSRAPYNGLDVRHIFDIIGQTFRALWAHKLRSFLTMFGIAWGVGSLLLLVGLGEGFRAGNRKQFDSLGENVMFIWSGRAPVMQGSFTALRQYYLTYRDYEDILRECPSVAAAAPAISRGDIRAVSDFFQASGQIVGVPANFNQIRYLPVNEGRWINALDDAQKRTVIVIGDEVRRTLFPGRPAIGATILLNGVRFTVIGTLQKVGHGDNMNLNLRSFVPFHAMQDYFRPLNTGIATDVISFINYQPKSRALHVTAQQEVHKIIARNHGFDPKNPDAFDEWDTIKTVDQIGKIFDAMNMFLGSVGLVTLGAGSDRHHQHHAGCGRGPDARNRFAQSGGRNELQHHVPVFCGRSISDAAEWRHRHCRRCWTDGHAVGSRSRPRVRSAQAGRIHGVSGCYLAGSGWSRCWTISGAARRYA